VVDAIYFATVTMTTTGYGDLKPLTVENRAVTLVYMFFGFLIAFPSIATAMAPFYARMELCLYQVSAGVLRCLLGNRGEANLVDIDGDGLADYEEPPKAYIYYIKGISSWVVIWLSMQVAFAAGYQALEPQVFDDFEKAFYLCIVTATTVGYGDIAVPDRWQPKLYASVHILVSVSSLAALLNTTQALYAERKIQLRKASLLERKLDGDLIVSLDKDGNGLDKLEFVIGMLTKLEILQWDDVEPFLAKFDELDKDGSGRLDREDLARMVEEDRLKAEALKARKLTLTRKDTATIGAPSSAASPLAPASSDLENGLGGKPTLDTVRDFSSAAKSPTSPRLQGPTASPATAGKTRPPPPVEILGGGPGVSAIEGGLAEGLARRKHEGAKAQDTYLRTRSLFGNKGLGNKIPLFLMAGAKRQRRPVRINKKRISPGSRK